jgi:hypothetical protein
MAQTAGREPERQFPLITQLQASSANSVTVVNDPIEK